MHYKSKKKNRSTIYVEDEMYAATAKGAYGKLSNRWSDVDINLQVTYRRRKNIWKRKTWSRTYDFIQKQ